MKNIFRMKNYKNYRMFCEDQKFNRWAAKAAMNMVAAAPKNL